MKVRRGYRQTRLGDPCGRCSFQAQLIGNRLFDNDTLEEVRIVARVQHCGIANLIERIEEPHSQALKVVHIASD